MRLEIKPFGRSGAYLYLNKKDRKNYKLEVGKVYEVTFKGVADEKTVEGEKP